MRGPAQAREEGIGPAGKGELMSSMATLQIFLRGVLPLARPGCVVLTPRTLAGQAEVQVWGAMHTASLGLLLLAR